MKKYLDENFLLDTKTAQDLYHGFAKLMPIIDYHNHLSPAAIANDDTFENITQVWLYGDHYKWRTMRTNGVAEKFCTGDATDREKFLQWAATVPYTLRNPLHHWTHLELQRYFDIHELLNSTTAASIYDRCNEKLSGEGYSVRGLLKRMNVKILCTTDDPIDSLEYHEQIRDSGFEVKVLPAFRPDKAMAAENTPVLNDYINKLESVSGKSVSTYQDYISALRLRHDFFGSMGCCVSDHGLEQLYAEPYTEAAVSAVFAKLRAGKDLNHTEVLQFKSAMLIVFAEWDYEKGWVQQYHLGALRNNNVRRLREFGADTGWDSIGDFAQAQSLSRFLGTLDNENKLTRTILYNLNPADNEVMATMIGNFNDGSSAGKIQWGSAWWFLDQKDGMIKQMNALSNMGLLSRFVGMLTDSRSFLSFPRHEYFRRLLCNLVGTEMEHGELPDDMEWSGKIIQDICYYNAHNYFPWQ